MKEMMSKEYFQKEEAYQMTMYYVRKMLNKALISPQEYDAIDRLMRQNISQYMCHTMSTYKWIYIDIRALMY